MSTICLAITGLEYRYPTVDAQSASATLRFPDVTISEGAHTVLIGPSGSGKSTLINAITGLIVPTAGRIEIDGVDLSKKSARERDQLRGEKIGLVMQRLHLIGALSVLDNLRMAQKIARGTTDDDLIMHLLQSLNIGDKAKRFPRALSQGEAQRAAIARALVNRPRILIADEPTSALDDVNAEAAIALLLAQAREQRATLIVATHDARIKSHFQNVISLHAGASA
jgi:ABC-type lipoprotein export system ATPase subunit